MENGHRQKLAQALRWVLLLLAGYALWASSDSRVQPSTVAQSVNKTSESLATPYLDQVSEGDLVFRLGKGRWSPMFAAGNPDTGFSHVGVIDRSGHSQGNIFVLHADADDDSWEGGVQRTPLELFLQESESYEFRRNNMQSHERAAFMAALRQAWHDKVGFDTDFTLDDQGQRFYCTEYVWWAAGVAGVSLARPTRLMGVDVITVDSIYASPLLTGL